MSSGCCDPCLANRTGSSGNKVTVASPRNAASHHASQVLSQCLPERPACCSPRRKRKNRAHHLIDHGKEMLPEPKPHFWHNDVVAASVSGPGYRAFDDPKPGTMHIKGYELKPIRIRTPSSWHDWLDWVGAYPAWLKIEAYTEYRHYSLMSSIPLGVLERAGLTVFIVLEIGNAEHSDNSQRAICIEKSSDQLEILVGIPGEPTSVVTDFAKLCGASGKRRIPNLWRSMKTLPRCRVGAVAGMEELNVLDLLWWINGPVADKWSAYDPLLSNSQHLSQELIYFLTHGCAEHDALNRDLVMAAVKQDGMNLQLATETMRCDPEIVLAAVSQDPNALEFAAKKLQAARDIILASVQYDGMALRFAAKELQDDRDVVAFAVRQNGRSLLFASERLQGDRGIVLLAVDQDPFSLQFGAPTLLADRDIMAQAIAVHPTALRYASEELRADRDLVRQAIKGDRRAIRLASPELQEDWDLLVLSGIQDHISKAHECPLDSARSSARSGRRSYRPELVDLSPRGGSGRGGSGRRKKGEDEEDGDYVCKAVVDPKVMKEHLHRMSTSQIQKDKKWHQFNDVEGEHEPPPKVEGSHVYDL